MEGGGYEEALKFCRAWQISFLSSLIENSFFFRKKSFSKRIDVTYFLYPRIILYWFIWNCIDVVAFETAICFYFTFEQIKSALVDQPCCIGFVVKTSNKMFFYFHKMMRLEIGAPRNYFHQIFIKCSEHHFQNIEET